MFSQMVKEIQDGIRKLLHPKRPCQEGGTTLPHTGRPRTHTVAQDACTLLQKDQRVAIFQQREHQRDNVMDGTPTPKWGHVPLGSPQEGS